MTNMVIAAITEAGGAILKTHQELLILERGTLARDLLSTAAAQSRFLADKPGFGMTRCVVR